MHQWEDSLLGSVPQNRPCHVRVEGRRGQLTISTWLDMDDIQVQVANHLNTTFCSVRIVSRSTNFVGAQLHGFRGKDALIAQVLPTAVAEASLRGDVTRAISLHAHHGRADIITTQIRPVVPAPSFLMSRGFDQLLGEILVEAIEKRRRGFTYAVRTLLECKADISTPNPRNKTSNVLTTAAQLGYAQVVAFLLDNAAKEPSDRVLQNALLDAVKASHRDTVNVLTSEIFNRYYNAVHGRGDKNKKKKIHLRMAEMLGPDIMSAAASQHDETIALNLLDMRADADPSVRGQLRYPLTAAAKKGCVGLAECLLSHGANINGGAETESEDLQTTGFSRKTSPLYEAVSANFVEMTTLLLTRLANPEYGAFGISPLVEAAGRANEALVDLLLRFRAEINPVTQNVGGNGSGNDDMDPDKPFPIERQTGTRTPLHAACGGFWRCGSKPLEDQVRQNVVQKLLRAKADIWALDEFGVSPAARAAKADCHTLAGIVVKELELRRATMKKTPARRASGSRAAKKPRGY